MARQGSEAAVETAASAACAEPASGDPAPADITLNALAPSSETSDCPISSSPASENPAASARERILQAASLRFLHFGYGKTTMAEIAADCQMSPGNLYRFFESKLDIGEAIGRRFHDEQVAQYWAVVRAPGRSPEQRLRDYMDLVLQSTFSVLDDKPRLFELVRQLASERLKFANDTLAQDREPMVAVIRDGQRLGDFIADDPHFLAEMLQCATFKFRFPQLWSNLDYQALRRELHGVSDILLRGLKKNPG
jgi:AcrR family transcriptional regulator